MSSLIQVQTFNRLAYLNRLRNVRRGLFSRTHIIEHLDSNLWISTSEIASRIHVTSHTVLYHLRNMERESVVERDSEGKGWRLGPYEQSELAQFLSVKKKRKKK
ncbi:MAG: FaeA/PapI family transcriptional regulator [Candidatus Thorarchaeota archaeon]|jgi:predicted transcriptional regulator